MRKIILMPVCVDGFIMINGHRPGAHRKNAQRAAVRAPVDPLRLTEEGA
jgi:hypothetical protein